jgi:hypothetical protein
MKAWIIPALVLLSGSGLVALEFLFASRYPKLKNLAMRMIGVVAALNIGLVIALWINHINFPLFIDLMEGVVWQHFQRAIAFQPIYPAPTPEYVPLAYNPLYYVISIPFGWIFGVNLFTLRLVAILGTMGSAAILFLAVRRETGSLFWAFVSVGLFAAAYAVMDAYLDTAHSDSWLLFCALLGTYLIHLNRSWKLDGIGLLVLIAAFWFKQHGAVFAFGGILYLTVRHGIKKSIVYWLAAILLGPALYLLAGPFIFGSNFLYFTWEVPRNWSEFGFATLRRYLGFIIKSYLGLALTGGLVTLWSLFRNRAKTSIWYIQFIFACLTGLMGSLDIGSSNNVYIPMGTWFILVGVLGLKEFCNKFPKLSKYTVPQLVLVLSFALFAYNPLPYWIPAGADDNYAEFVSFLEGLDGQVYAPTLGQMPKDFTLYPAAHWVALEDMIRGPGRDTSNHPLTREMLDPAIHPDGPAYVLTNYPFEVYYWIQFLEDYYVLEEDLGDRFQPVRLLPKRWDHGWPRYLYRYDPEGAAK